MKIFFYFLREYDELKYCEQFAKETGIGFGYSDAYPTIDTVELARGYDAVSMTPCEVSADMVRAWHEMGVKYICCRSIGYDHVDLEAAKACGMRVSNASYPPNGVANYAIMLMLMLSRRIVPILERAKVQDYTLKGKVGNDISSSVVGVIGTGQIGLTVVRHLSGFGCRILAYDPFPKEEVKEYAEYVSLEKLYAESDFITLHANVTPENIHLLDEDAFAKMKDGVSIVNTARGKLIDTDALIKNLESGKIGSAALDVLETEDGLYYYNRVGDVIVNHQMAILRSYPNVILAPHTAFYSEENVGFFVRSVFESANGFEHGQVSGHEIL